MSPGCSNAPRDRFINPIVSIIMSINSSSARPKPDLLFAEIADYVAGPGTASAEAYETARYCLMDTIGCGILALNYPACTKLLGPVVPGTVVPNGCRVPGTNFELDPVTGAFNIGCMIRWLDFNDTWLAAEWGHPSDNLGGILAVADFLSRNRQAEGVEPGQTFLESAAALRRLHGARRPDRDDQGA